MNDFEKSLKILQLNKDNLSINSVKNSYKKLIKLHHPDLHKSKENKEKATKNFKLIQNAYEYLIDYCINCTPVKNNYKTNTDKENNNDNSVRQAYYKSYREHAKQKQKEYYKTQQTHTKKENNYYNHKEKNNINSKINSQQDTTVTLMIFLFLIIPLVIILFAGA